MWVDFIFATKFIVINDSYTFVECLKYELPSISTRGLFDLNEFPKMNAQNSHFLLLIE